MNGAIPVVVGSQDEIEITFKYEENPPWIFAKTWEDALQQCKSILGSNIDNSLVMNWWNQRIQKIKSKINDVL